MKTKLHFNIAITIMLILMCASTSKAQFSFGVKGGMNESTISNLGDIYGNQDYRPGFNIGGIVNYHFSDNVMAQFEVNYGQKGKKTRTFNSIQDYDLNTNCNYLSIPLVVRGSTLINQKNMRMYGETGTYYGFIINNEKGTSSLGNGNKFYNNDYGFVLGGGIIKPINNLNLVVGFRYEMGLAKMYKMDTDLRNKSLSLNIEIQF